MLKAKAVGLGTSNVSEINGPAVVVYDAFDNPLVIVVELSKGLQHVYSLAIDEAEFIEAIERYGIQLKAKVTDLRI